MMTNHFVLTGSIYGPFTGAVQRVMKILRPALVLAVLCALIASPAQAVEPAQPANEVTANTFRNPVNGGADPSLFFHNGQYHVATTTGDHIGIWSSPS